MNSIRHAYGRPLLRHALPDLFCGERYIDDGCLIACCSQRGKALNVGHEMTEDGKALLEKAEALESLIPLLTEVEQTIPTVKVSAGTWVTQYLCGHVSGIVGTDRIRLRFIAADEVLDIGRREALIGIRNQRPDCVGLAGRKVGRVQFAICCGTDAKAPWARVLGHTPSAQWVLANIGSEDSIEVTSPRNALDLALAGQARVVLPTFIGDRIDTLTQVSPLIADLAHDQWLVTHHEDRYLPEVRKVIDRISTILRAACSRD